MDPPPLATVQYFTGAKNFTIHNGRFRTIAGNSYTGCYPPPQSVSPVQARPPITSKTSFFERASNFDINGGDFSVIEGDAVDLDLGPTCDAMGPVYFGSNDDEMGVDGHDPAPQVIGNQDEHDLDVPQGSEENEVASTDVPTDENVKPPPRKGKTINLISPLNWITIARKSLWPSARPASSRDGLCD